PWRAAYPPIGWPTGGVISTRARPALISAANERTESVAQSDTTDITSRTVFIALTLTFSEGMGKASVEDASLQLIARDGEHLAGGGQRKSDLEARSFTQFAFNVDVTAVISDDAVAAGETQPRSLADLFCGDERC